MIRVTFATGLVVRYDNAKSWTVDRDGNVLIAKADDKFLAVVPKGTPCVIEEALGTTWGSIYQHRRPDDA